MVNKFIQHLTQLSNDNIYENALKEWRYVTKTKTHDYGLCLCQRKVKNIIYMYNIHNKNTVTIGTNCYQKFKLDSKKINNELVNTAVNNVVQRQNNNNNNRDRDRVVGEAPFKTIQDVFEYSQDIEDELIQLIIEKFNRNQNNIEELKYLLLLIQDCNRNYNINTIQITHNYNIILEKFIQLIIKEIVKYKNEDIKLEHFKDIFDEEQIKQIQIQIQKQLKYKLVETLNQKLKKSISCINIKINDIDFDNIQLYDKELIIDYIYTKYKKYQQFMEHCVDEDDINENNYFKEYYENEEIIKIIEDSNSYQNNNLLNQIQILINHGFRELKQVYNDIQDIINNIEFHIKNFIFMYSKNKIKYFDNIDNFPNVNFDYYYQYYNKTNIFFSTLLSKYKYNFINKIKQEFHDKFQFLKQQYDNYADIQYNKFNTLFLKIKKMKNKNPTKEIKFKEFVDNINNKHFCQPKLKTLKQDIIQKYDEYIIQLYNDEFKYEEYQDTNYYNKNNTIHKYFKLVSH